MLEVCYEAYCRVLSALTMKLYEAQSGKYYETLQDENC